MIPVGIVSDSILVCSLKLSLVEGFFTIQPGSHSSVWENLEIKKVILPGSENWDIPANTLAYYFEAVEPKLR